MKKLFDVEVFGLSVPVYAKKGLEASGVFGISEFTTKPKRIVIDSDLSIEEFTKTLAHECIHFMFYRLNLQLPYEIEEMLCETSVIPLFRNFRLSLLPKHLKILEAHQKKTRAS